MVCLRTLEQTDLAAVHGIPNSNYFILRPLIFRSISNLMPAINYCAKIRPILCHMNGLAVRNAQFRLSHPISLLCIFLVPGIP